MAYRSVEDIDAYTSENEGETIPLTSNIQGLLKVDHSNEARSARKKLIIKAAIFSVFLIGAIVIFFVPILQENVPARHCLSVLIVITSLWVTELAPVWAASLAVPILVVWGSVYVDTKSHDPNATIIHKDAAVRVASAFFSSSVMLALGAFTMSTALTKYQLSDRLAYFVLSKVGRRPTIVLLTIMFLGLFLAMWISNVASPVVCLSVIRPLIRDLPPDDPYIRVILLGIAFSNNIGGMTTPISSPQNIVAANIIRDIKVNITVGGVQQTRLDVTWPEWLAAGIPISIVCTLIVFGVLWLFFRPTIVEVPELPETQLAKFTIKHAFVLFVCTTIIVLWALDTQINSFTGNNGITGLIPVVVFFGTGILSKDDFKGLAWDVLMLLAGGMVLGDAINGSNLLALIATKISEVVATASHWVILIAFASLMWIVGNFVSHTVSAIILLPVIAKVGCAVGHGDNPCIDGHTRLLVIAACIIDSCAMGLPVSSFPNAQMYSEQDRHGRPYLAGPDFMKTGFVIGILCLGLLISAGYFLLMGIGF